MRLLGPVLAFLFVLTGCGSEYANVQPDNPTKVADGLVVTRADGSSYEMTDAVAECAHSVTSGTEYVYLSVPAEKAGTADPQGPAFVIEVASGVTGTRELPLRDRTPLVASGHGMGPVDLLVLANDPLSGGPLGAFGQHARGTVEVTEASCDPDPRLTFRIDATLLSPTGRTVTIRGGMATIT